MVKNLVRSPKLGVEFLKLTSIMMEKTYLALGGRKDPEKQVGLIYKWKSWK